MENEFTAPSVEMAVSSEQEMTPGGDMPHGLQTCGLQVLCCSFDNQVRRKGVLTVDEAERLAAKDSRQNKLLDFYFTRGRIS